MAFENRQGINAITLFGKTHLYCPMGDDLYTAEISVQVTEPVMILDYIDFADFLKTLDGADLIIEDFMVKVFDFIKTETASASSIVVKVYVEDAHSHYPVELIKQG